MIYTYLGIESTKSHTKALCSGQSLLNTVLHSGLKKCLGFPIKQHSFSIFSGALGLKKNKKDSKEIKTKKPQKSYNVVIGTGNFSNLWSSHFK